MRAMDRVIVAQPIRVGAERASGPPKPFSPQADRMTQPVSRSARWLGADLTCSESSDADSETLTCEEPHTLLCAAERPPRVTSTEEHRDGGVDAAARDAGVPGTVNAPPGVDAPRTRSFCDRADTVAEGFLCNDRVAVSNACRKPTNAFDEFVCDDPRMRELQWAILRETWAFIKAIALALVRAKP
jgi:hypothetical protein